MIVEPMDIPGKGVMACYTDSTGAAIGAWQSPDVMPQAVTRRAPRSGAS